ncbi:unnamed protein product [Coffea canephora]|uniref:Secreted protein n=1 Tax=Coffea canephora TaxID=49390 RepID=A0A068UVJ4_COFCA|nr:unnamed protein product [Coffea canephora]
MSSRPYLSLVTLLYLLTRTRIGQGCTSFPPLSVKIAYSKMMDMGWMLPSISSSALTGLALRENILRKN